MPKEPLVAPRTKTEQPNAAETRKDQKHFQMPEEYDSLSVNKALDEIHERINKLATEALSAGDVIEDLAAAATLPVAVERINVLTEILRNAGLLRRTK